MVCVGWKPEVRSVSTASRMASSPALSSRAPRPQMKPSAIAPEKGGCFQAVSVRGSTGTTSRWARRRMGGAEGVLPGQVKRRLWAETISGGSSLWISGKEVSRWRRRSWKGGALDVALIVGKRIETASRSRAESSMGRGAILGTESWREGVARVRMRMTTSNTVKRARRESRNFLG